MKHTKTHIPHCTLHRRSSCTLTRTHSTSLKTTRWPSWSDTPRRTSCDWSTCSDSLTRIKAGVWTGMSSSLASGWALAPGAPHSQTCCWWRTTSQNSGVVDILRDPNKILNIQCFSHASYSGGISKWSVYSGHSWCHIYYTRHKYMYMCIQKITYFYSRLASIWRKRKSTNWSRVWIRMATARSTTGKHIQAVRSYLIVVFMYVPPITVTIPGMVD